MCKNLVLNIMYIVKKVETIFYYHVLSVIYTQEVSRTMQIELVRLFKWEKKNSYSLTDNIPTFSRDTKPTILQFPQVTKRGFNF